MFSPEMQVALPLDKAVEFFTGLKNQAGQITSRQFIKYESTYAVYKTHFERGLYGVNISIENHSKINGLFFKPYTDEVLPMIERNRSTMILPFKEEWYVVWGGDTKALNYHIDNKAQKNAFDFIILDENGKSFRTDGQKNEDYYAFGKEIIAPCDGEIVLMVDGIKENKPGEFNAIYIPGNSIILKTEQNEFLFFAHFKQHSIKVKQGDKVIRGQVLGLCGNTGNSSEPHLHFHIQNVENMNIATGAKCYFEKIIANGEIKTDYSPVKNDKIKNY
jgi:murein DD-endopeptidase MepM/ murein hydrolase activator NlpD